MAGNAGLFGGIGPVAAVNQAYAPQQAYLQQQQASRNAALQAIFQAILGALPSQQSVDAPYLAASQDTNNLARASAAGLQAANPDAQTQAGLRAIGAPASQQQQVGNIDNTSFNGNAALLQYAGGVIPSGVFNQDMQARNTYLASLPAILAGYAKQGVGQLAGIADKENMGLAQDRANALMKARTDLANFVQQNQSAKANAAYKKAQLGLQSQKLGLAAQNQAFNQKYKGAELGLQGEKLQLQAGHYKDLSAQAWARIGLSQKSLQLRAKALDRKQAAGGFTPYQMNRFKTDAGFVAQQAATAQTMPPYGDAMQEMLKRHVPPAVAAAALAKVYPETRRPITPQTRSDYAQTTGKIPGLVPLAAKYGLDPRAVMSVAAQEGLGGGVGDGGTSFGPFQLHIGGALPKAIARRGPEYAQRWAWSIQGVDYALRQMSKVARGLSGQQAVDAIVRGFERPKNPGKESASAAAYYGRMGA